MLITFEMLTQKGACERELSLFKRLFPEGVKVTEALCLSYSKIFSWSWAAVNLLPVDAQACYNLISEAAWAKYARIADSAYFKYNRIRKEVWAECKLDRGAFYGKYESAHEVARAEYDRIIKEAWAEYKRTTAGAFGKLAERL